jgi:integrase
VPKFPKPFFRAPRGLWYVQLDGKQINLGPDRDAAFASYHELMTRPSRRPVATDSVAAILDAFLDWCRHHRAARTYEWYRDYLQSFVSHAPRNLTVGKLRPIHVQQWVDAQAGWKTGKRGAIVAVQRAFNWAAKMGLIESSPVRHVEKPRAGRRDVVITSDEYASILAHVADEEFRDLVVTCWETGCRPQEILSVEARHLDRAGSRWVFPPEEAKGKRRHRVVYLSEAALAITERLATRWPRGPLFRNTDGRPWHPYALNCRFARLRRAWGREEVARLGLVPPKIRRLTRAERADPGRRAEHDRAMEARRGEICRLTLEHGRRWCLYHFRHSFATRLLESGVDSLTVSSLLGHADGAMLARVYSHIDKSGELMRLALRRGGEPAPREIAARS